MKIELKDIPEDSKEKYYVILKCADCGAELNRTKKITGKELHENWITIVMGSGFNAGKCKNGCRSTFSDLNINTKLEIKK